MQLDIIEIKDRLKRIEANQSLLNDNIIKLSDLIEDIKTILKQS